MIMLSDISKIPEVQTIVARCISYARANQIALEIDDFTLIDGEACIDGMTAAEWLSAMTGEYALDLLDQREAAKKEEK